MAYRFTISVASLALAVALGCGDSGSNTGGSSGRGAGGSGGQGGAPPPPCQTNVLCPVCPDETSFCGSNDDCGTGFVCIASGCSTNDGLGINSCELAPAGFCDTTDDCPAGRECMDLGEEGRRCVKLNDGCDSAFDCVLGFECEAGVCVDRRVPCVRDEDCPMSHVCFADGVSRLCLRVHRRCESDLDCAELAPLCEDIDGDGSTECAGSFDPNKFPPPPCLNAGCTDPGAPVCELSGVGSTTVCGLYGLCVDGADCADGFECVGLWTDGRRECVPTGGSCSHTTDCPIQTICASPRTGGPPSCQTGFLP